MDCIIYVPTYKFTLQEIYFFPSSKNLWSKFFVIILINFHITALIVALNCCFSCKFIACGSNIPSFVIFSVLF